MAFRQHAYTDIDLEDSPYNPSPMDSHVNVGQPESIPKVTNMVQDIRDMK